MDAIWNFNASHPDPGEEGEEGAIKTANLLSLYTCRKTENSYTLRIQ